MANTLSKSGIVTGQDVEAWHVTQSVDAFTKVDAYDITVSGSFTVTGSIKIRGVVSGRTSQTSSVAITSSYAGDQWSYPETIYVSWRTPITWVTPASKVSHNLVLYCTRDSNPL